MSGGCSQCQQNCSGCVEQLSNVAEQDTEKDKWGIDRGREMHTTADTCGICGSQGIPVAQQSDGDVMLQTLVRDKAGWAHLLAPRLLHLFVVSNLASQTRSTGLYCNLRCTRAYIY